MTASATHPRTVVQLLLLFVIVVPLALVARWQLGDRGWGPNFLPHPDSLEYAAGAQSLARFGDYFLQIGPHRFAPRYPPGWSLVLSAAVRAGLPGQSLWRVTAVFGALLAFLLALAAYVVLRTWPERSPPPLRAAASWTAFGAALSAGLVWAFAPLPVFLGQTGLSDEPCLCLSVAAVLLTLAAVCPQAQRSAPRLIGAPWLVAAGLLMGMVAAMRFISAALLVLPLALCCAAGGPRGRWRRTIRRLAWIGCGALVALAVAAILSGRMPWQWSGYAFWIPRWYTRLGDTFNPVYALWGNAAYFEPMGVKPFSHLFLGLQVLLGLPGRWEIAYLGKGWPLLGWVAAAAGAYKVARSAQADGCARWTAAGMGVWVLLHLVLFSIYFYPAPRFYLAPMAVCLVAFAVGCGRTASAGGRRRAAGALAAAAVVAATVVMGQEIPAPPELRPSPNEVSERFSQWLAAGDAGRRGRPVPFDLVQAQALGLYTPQALARVTEWGQLPRQPHVVRLLAGGHISRRETVLP